MFPGAYLDTLADKPAVVMAGSGFTQTFAELDAAANRLSQVLRSAGLQPGDHVALCMENHDRYLEVLWGCRYAGLIYTAASSRLTSGELAYILDDCGAKAFITSLYLADQAAEIIADTPGVRLRLMLDGTIDGYDSYEDADRRAVVRTARRSHRRHRHALLLGHDRPAEGRPAAVRTATARDVRDGRGRAAESAVRSHERIRLPVAGAPLPRRTAAVLHGDAHDRQHGRRDGALRRRAVPAARRDPSHHAQPGRADDVRPDDEARSRGAGAVRPVVAAMRHPCRRAVPDPGEEGHHRVVRAGDPRVLRRHRGERLRLLQQ